MAGKPNLLWKILSVATILVLNSIIQGNQENSIPIILVILGIGLKIFCLVQNIYLVFDFGLFEFFIGKSMVIMFSIYGLKSFLTLGFSLFCLVLIGVNYWIEEKKLNAVEIEKKLNDQEIVRSRCFMDISIDNGKIPEGRIVFELYDDMAPKTVKNFKSFCREGHYKKTIFHYVRSHILTGGKKLSPVDDSGIIKNVDYKHELHHMGEKSPVKHNQAGLLSTFSNTVCNSSEFFITMSACAAEYNYISAVFGKVVKGMDLLKEIKKVAVDNEFQPMEPVEIVNCGVIPEGADEDDFCNLFGEKDQYPDWPQEIAVNEKRFTWWLAAVGSLQILGSFEKKMRNYERAVVKYKKALRYSQVCSTGKFVDKDKASDSILDEFKCLLSKELDECLWKFRESNLKPMKLLKEPCNVMQKPREIEFMF